MAKDLEIRLKTRLAGAAVNGLVPSGAAEFRQRGTDMRFTAEVEDVNLAPGTVLRVCVAGAEVGTITLEAMAVGAAGDLNLNTRDGDTVPSMSKGNVVEVRNGDCTTGAAILAGAL